MTRPNQDSTTGRLSKSARRVQKALLERGVRLQVLELPQSTRTAAEAANAIGCAAGQIAKSLVFRTAETHRAILVITSGANRVHTTRLKSQVGETLDLANPAFVRQQTGFAIGGVPPVGHTEPIQTFIDQDLLKFEEIWAAAGTPFAVFRLSPEDLLALTSGTVIAV